LPDAVRKGYGGRVTPPRRARRRHTEPEAAASLVNEVVARIGGQARALEHRVFDAYTASVGVMMREKTRPEKLRGTTLFVRVSSSALAHSLTMLRAEILSRMSVDLGPGVVSDLRTRVGPLRA
jgi:predicted nucleic acid-binding Zn ribbon protein